VLAGKLLTDAKAEGGSPCAAASGWSFREFSQSRTSPSLRTAANALEVQIAQIENG
jgi:hypothetical protein